MMTKFEMVTSELVGSALGIAIIAVPAYFFGRYMGWL